MVTLRAPWDHFEAQFGGTLEYLCRYSGVTVRKLWDNFGGTYRVTMTVVWGHLVGTLEVTLGVYWGHFEGTLGVTLGVL